MYVHKLVSDKDSDYKKFVDVADFFAKQGKEVRLTPKKQWHSEFDYDSIYGSLKGTKYYGECPDLCIGGLWYEHEGFVYSNYKRAFRNMITHGLKKSDRIVIDDPKLSDGYMLRSIYGHIKQGKDISEVWIKDGKNLRLLYKNRQ